MSFAEQVEREITEFRESGVTARDFRLAVAETISAEVGIENNRVGSAYAPLSIKEVTGGSFLVQWSDGRVSSGSLSRAPGEALEEVLLSAFHGRYEDPDEAVFPRAAPVPEVALESAAVAAAAAGEAPDVLPDVLAALERVRERLGARLMDASAQATVVRRSVVSSGGFRAESKETGIGFSIALDSLVGDGFSRREPFPKEEVERLASLTAADYEALKAPAKESPRGATAVVLHPRVAEQFLRTFLLGNLSGGAVANGRSRFSADDFRGRRRVFREDLLVSVRPLRPLSPGSFRFTDEGVAAREFPLVDAGCLRTPFLSLKHAKKLSMEPAPAPPEIDGFRFELTATASREEALRGGRVVLVHSVLGMHTQDATRGEYSLLCPQGVVYFDGMAAGRVTATLNGSFFRDLQSDDLALVDFPGFSCPGLALTMSLS